MERITVPRTNNLGNLCPDAEVRPISSLGAMTIAAYRYGSRRNRNTMPQLDALSDVYSLEIHATIPTPRGDKIVMDLWLDRPRNAKDFHVHYAMVDSKFQGYGIAPAVYREILKNVPGMIISAGSAQSTGGRGIWSQLSKFDDVLVYGGTSSDNVHELFADDELGELYSDEVDEMYESRSFRAFAIAR